MNLAAAVSGAGLVTIAWYVEYVAPHPCHLLRISFLKYNHKELLKHIIVCGQTGLQSLGLQVYKHVMCTLGPNIYIYIYIYATPPPKDLPKSMPSEIFLATFIPTVQIMMTQTGGGHVKTCTYPGFTQMFQTGQ